MASDSLAKNSRVYWLAFIAYWGIVLFGYDAGIAGGVVSQQYFLQSFGLLGPDGKKDVKKTNAVSSNVVSVLQAGAFFGALGSAPFSSKYGRKPTLVASTGIFLIGAILTTVAAGDSKGLALIYAGRVIAGFGIGAISAVAPAFVSECSPKEIRGRITGMFQIMVALGGMISYFINYAIGLHIHTGANVWRIPFGFQLVPAGIMVIGLFTVSESPRWLATTNNPGRALKALAYLRKLPENDPAIIAELAEIEAAIAEERAARKGLGLREAFLGKGNLIRFVIAFVIFVLQQWSGQNSVGYYAPQIFTSLGFTGPTNGLLASGIYGVVKVAATAIFVFFAVDTLGRKPSLFISGLGMGSLFFIVGAILKTHPPPAAPPPGVDVNPPPASRAMAGMLYIYVCFYSMGWGPLPWVYVSDIFPTRTRHYGLSLASATQWLFNFVLAKITPTLVSTLGYKVFFMFGAINIGGMAVFSLLIPETKGRSLEEMDVIFGAVSAEDREEFIQRQQRELEHGHGDEDSSVGKKDSTEKKEDV